MMARLLKVTMEMSITVVQVVPADTDVGALSPEDMADIAAAGVDLVVPVIGEFDLR